MLNIQINVPSDPAACRQLEAMPDVRVTDTVIGDGPEEFSRQMPLEIISETEILFCPFPPLNHAVMTNLKLIQVTSAGYSQLLQMNLPQRGVRACNGAGVFDAAVAEWNVAMMINLKRNLRQMIHNQERGVWDRPGEFQQEIRDSVVGIWGYGALGRQTARLCKAIGVTVHALTKDGAHPKPNQFRLADTGDPEGTLPDKVFVADEREAFLADLDFLVLSMPLNAATKGILGEAEFQILPDSALLLNPARGHLVNEDVLLRALRQGWIAGAAIDTHYHYPMPVEHPLWQFPNVIMTPHISGSAAGPYYLPRVWQIFVENVRRFQAREPLLNELSAEQLSQSA